jgi:hypothetical protein
MSKHARKTLLPPPPRLRGLNDRIQPAPSRLILENGLVRVKGRDRGQTTCLWIIFYALLIAPGAAPGFLFLPPPAKNPAAGFSVLWRKKNPFLQSGEFSNVAAMEKMCDVFHVFSIISTIV